MIKTLTREAKARGNILGLKVRQFFHYLLWCQSIRQQVQDIGYTDAHPADAGLAAPFARLNSDEVGVVHTRSLPACRRAVNARHPRRPPAAELVIRSTGAGLFITAARHAISVRRSARYGADCFIPVRSVDVSRSPLSIAFRSAPIETAPKSSVIQRSVQPAVKRPAVAGAVIP